MNFNYTINFGDVLTIASFGVILYGFHIKNVKRIQQWEIRMNIIWNHVAKQLGIDDSNRRD